MTDDFYNSQSSKRITYGSPVTTGGGPFTPHILHPNGGGGVNGSVPSIVVFDISF